MFQIPNERTVFLTLAWVSLVYTFKAIQKSLLSPLLLIFSLSKIINAECYAEIIFLGSLIKG